MTAISDPSLTVLVVDDTVVYRKTVTDAVGEIPGVCVVGSAHNGKAAMVKVDRLNPDLLVLDIEMPEMNGLEVLSRLRADHPHTGAIILSTLTHQGGAMTMRALELGAFDFIPKPQAGTMEENKRYVREELESRIKAFNRSRMVKKLLHSTKMTISKPKPSPAVAASQKSAVRSKSEVVAIGISTGGPAALARVVPRLPANLGAPVLIVQHMPPIFTHSLAESLNAKSALQVKEAQDGEILSVGKVYIAPGGKQMRVSAGPDGRSRIIRITDDPPEQNCKPSADYLFRSIAEHFVGRATAVIMTGMGSDGLAGLRLLRQNGATIIAQDQASCVVYGMPKGPTEEGLVHFVLPLDRMAHAIASTVAGGATLEGGKV
jgi:two-component system, chemotaxis family, protein-glutamate methylesterase/glutaminase